MENIETKGEAYGKDEIRSHWTNEPCGTRGIDKADRRGFFDQLERERYEVEPYIKPFAKFEEARGKKVLEVGVGAGTDFINWVRNGADATGVDLTQACVDLTSERISLEGRSAKVIQSDAENLPFPDATFDIVYSWGVLHVTPDTPRAFREVHRVLKPGGEARIMIYHSQSWMALLLWGVHCAGKLRPWKSPRWAAYHHLESPGTKLYSVDEARELCAMFSSVDVKTLLGTGDLLLMRPSAKYSKWPYDALWKAYPRELIKRTGDRFGMTLMITAKK
ncbi:class I SAM-dependent methyltransferase [Sorangium sp. So ce375]|uniref:class I SAM-dependent methyltransferase n=1 Tax=Sorangium sp. So ce375 TaxID=3133306 RepID=UPI003F5BAAE3